MKALRTKLTYANVVATLALFLAIGGASAFAATQLAKNSVGSKQLKKNAVTAVKIKDGAIAPEKLSSAASSALRGATGPQGSQGLQGPPGPQGPAGEALAYANVEKNGQVTAGKSKGITSANVTRIGVGEYCIGGLPFTVHIAVANTPLFLRGASTFVGNFQKDCPAGTQVNVETWDTSLSANEDAPFMILLD
jgi:hypothetical protein